MDLNSRAACRSTQAYGIYKLPYLWSRASALCSLPSLPSHLTPCTHTGRGTGGSISDVVQGPSALSISRFGFSILDGRKPLPLWSQLASVPWSHAEQDRALFLQRVPQRCDGAPRASPKPPLPAQDQDLLFCNLGASDLWVSLVMGGAWAGSREKACPGSECVQLWSDKLT